jgi:acyl-CoA synthetase (AMP-forming)/AMP-acid ligase II
MTVFDRVRSLGLRARAVRALLAHVPDLHRGAHTSGATLLERHSRARPDAPALFFLERTYTWAEVNEQANRWARLLLAEGVTRTDVVALVMDSRPEYVFALLGASKLGAVTACVNTNLTGSALAHAMRVANVRLVVAGSEHENAVDQVLTEVRPFGPPPRLLVQLDEGGTSERDPIDTRLAAMRTTDVGGPRPSGKAPMTYLYTSGTTGLPKAAIVTNQRFLLAAHVFGLVLCEATPADVIYVSLPLYHGTGQWGGLGTALTTGAAMALRRKFSASAFWKDAVRYRATRALYIGELCRYLLHQPPAPEDGAHSVQVAVGNGLRPDVWKPFQMRFKIPLIREFYGATEGNAVLANLEGRAGMLGRFGRGQAVIECDLESGKPRRGSDGRCRRIERPGEVGLFIGRISRLARFDGYLDQKATNSKVLRDVFRRGDTWFNSGDLVTLHEERWLSFADRVGDTFRWKGENVSTAEVALLINAAPGVVESNVFGVSLPGSDGKAGMACLVVAPDFDVGAFGSYAEERLPRYARPLFLRLLHDMQVTSTLKQKKTDYRSEGYDPARFDDPLFFSLDGRYERMTPEWYREIRAGKLVPR